MTRRTLLLAGTACAVALVGLCGYSTCAQHTRSRATTGTVFVTPGLYLSLDDEIIFRYADADRNSLLMACRSRSDARRSGYRQSMDLRLHSPAVFIYNASAQQLSAVSSDTWNAQQGRICAGTSDCLFPDMYMDRVSARISWRGQRISTYARYAMSFMGGHTGKFVAILSAEGPREGGLLPFFSDHFMIRGQVYAQIFDTELGVFVGSARKVSVGLLVGWSCDDRFLVFGGGYADGMVVMENEAAVQNASECSVDIGGS